MISNDKITEFFFKIDEFSKVFEPALKQNLLAQGKKAETEQERYLKQRGSDHIGHLSR